MMDSIAGLKNATLVPIIPNQLIVDELGGSVRFNLDETIRAVQTFIITLQVIVLTDFSQRMIDLSGSYSETIERASAFLRDAERTLDLLLMVKGLLK